MFGRLGLLLSSVQRVRVRAYYCFVVHAQARQGSDVENTQQIVADKW